MQKKICILAGESSGDLHASNLAKELKHCFSDDLLLFGMGGEKMREAGVRIDLNMEDVSVVGISEVVSKIFSIYKSFRNLSKIIKKENPDAIIAVDFPDFNFKVINFAKKLGIKVIYYITPQVWAWRRSRVYFLKEKVNLALNILPFEEEFLRKFGINSHYIGHPLLDVETKLKERNLFFKEIGLGGEKKIIAMLPGSRNSEVKAHFETLKKCASILNENRDDLVFLTPKAKGVDEKLYYHNLPPNLLIVDNSYYEVISYSDFGIVASGTATLECCLNSLPLIVFYKLNPITYNLGKKLIKLPNVSLPNIILKKEVTKEFIQEEFNEKILADEVLRRLKNISIEKENAKKIKDELILKLGNRGASKRAANKIAEFLST